MTVAHKKQHHAPHKHGTPHKKKKPLTNAQLAVRELYPHEKSPYKALPASKVGPGKLHGGHTITIQAWTLALSITCLLGADGGKLTGGYGVWNQIAVPRGDPLTQWTGRSLYTMDLDLVVDAWRKQTSIEPTLAKIDQLASRIPASLTPPAIRLYGAVPKPGLKWVITGIDWGDCLRLLKSGARARQELTLHLMEYRNETQLSNLKVAAKPKPPRQYKVKKGDDLKKIAARMLGKSSDWPQIEKANKGLRGWKLPAKWVGKTIKVPAKT